MLDIILEILASVAQSLAGVVANIQDGMQQITWAVADWVGDLVSTVTNQVRGMLSGIGDTISRIVAGVLDGISAYIEPVLQSVTGIVDEVREFFSDILNRLRTVVVTLWETITDRITEAMEYLRKLYSDVESYIRSLMQEAIEQVRGLVAGVSEWIVSVAKSAIQTVQSLAGSVIDLIAKGINYALGSVQKEIELTIELINRGWQQLVTGAESIIGTVNRRLQDVKQGMADIAEDLVRSLGEMTEEQVKEVRKGAESIVNKLLEFMPPEEVRFEQQKIQNAVQELSGIQASRAAFMGMWQKLLPSSPVGHAIFYAVFLAVLPMQVYAGISGRLSDIIEQEWAAQYQPAILGEGNTVAAWRRGDLTTGECVANLARHGFAEKNALRILRGSQGAPSPVELVAMWRRGIRTREELDVGLQQNGMAEEWREPFIKLTEIIPPPADLIQMAVREAFTPEVIARFGLSEDFPEEFGQWAQKQGLTHDWAVKYWIAHWKLPSAQQGFEMLHRRVKTREGGAFGTDELNLLLKALDVSPFWRLPLTEIAFRPFTRVDIRRMHRVGVLGDDEIHKAYTDLGYDDDHAAKLAEFTIRLNKPLEPEGADELGRLTRSTVLTFYREGLVDRARAGSLLVDLGITPEAAALFLDASDLADEREERQQQITIIEQRAISGLISKDQALNELRTQGATEAEVLKLQARLEREYAKRARIPTRSEGERMFALGIIPEQAYGLLLERLGYAQEWIPAYIQLARLKIKPEEE